MVASSNLRSTYQNFTPDFSPVVSGMSKNLPISIIPARSGKTARKCPGLSISKRPLEIFLLL